MSAILNRDAATLVLDVGKTGAGGTFSTDLLHAASGGGGGAIPNPPGGNVIDPPGQTWNFQYWHRTPSGVSGFSKALRVTFK